MFELGKVGVFNYCGHSSICSCFSKSSLPDARPDGSAMKKEEKARASTAWKQCWCPFPGYQQKPNLSSISSVIMGRSERDKNPQRTAYHRETQWSCASRRRPMMVMARQFFYSWERSSVFCDSIAERCWAGAGWRNAGLPWFCSFWWFTGTTVGELPVTQGDVSYYPSWICSSLFL